MEVYNVHKIQEGEYTFDTRKNLSYCIELKKSHLSYETIEGEIKYIYIFSFSIFDEYYAPESDFLTRNTILKFLLNHFSVYKNECILFYVNNELEKKSRRAVSRLKLFKRLFRYAIKKYNLDYVFLTNNHFIIEMDKYEKDHIGIII